MLNVVNEGAHRSSCLQTRAHLTKVAPFYVQCSPGWELFGESMCAR